MEKKILFVILDEEWKNIDKVFNYLDTIRKNIILYLKNDTISNKIKYYCIKNDVRYVYVKNINKEITDNIFKKVPLFHILIFSKNCNSYTNYINYCIEKAIENKINILNITETKKLSSFKLKGFKKKTFKIKEKIEYEVEYEDYSDEEYENLQNWKRRSFEEYKKKLTEKKVTTTKNQKKILKQHSYLKYKEQSENYKKKRIIPGQKKLDSFFGKKIKKVKKITHQ